MNDDFLGKNDAEQQQNDSETQQQLNFDGQLQNEQNAQLVDNSDSDVQQNEETVVIEDGNDGAANLSQNEYHFNKQQYEEQFGSGNYYERPVSPNSGNYNANQQNQYGYNNNGSYQSPAYNNQQGNMSNLYPNNTPPKKKNTGLFVFIGIIAFILIVAGGSMAALFVNDTDISEESSTNTAQTTRESIDNVSQLTPTESSTATGDAVTVANIAKKFNVGILVYADNSLYTEGSGVIVKEDDDGKYTYIVTCAHVVNYNGVSLAVLMEDGTEYTAELVGLDERTDLAVVRIEAKGLPMAELADSDSLVVGQAVYAVGNPGGSEFFGSVTDGIISAIGRPVSSSTGYEMECIQHTSAINPGNSGGALVNGEGNLIGINSMKIASTEYEGMGFSVPSNVVSDVFNSIIENGYVAGRAKLGIKYATPSNYSQTYAIYVQMKGLPSGTIVIAEVGSDSDLADKDVKVGDMIVAVNGEEMTSTDMLSGMIEDMSAGDKLTLTIVRIDSKDWTQTEFDVEVVLVEDTGNSEAQTPEINYDFPF